jgi:hypothetical protein
MLLVFRRMRVAKVAESREEAGFDATGAADPVQELPPSGRNYTSSVTMPRLAGRPWVQASAVAKCGIPFGINENVNFHSRRLVWGSRMRFGHRNAASDR